MTDWKKIAEARGLNIPAADLERIAPSLDALEAVFRPLTASIPHETEPAVVFHATAEDAQ